MKKLLLVLLLIPLVSSGQVKKSEVSIDRESAREELKNIGEELKITVTNDYDPDRSLTIDKGKFWRVDKKATVLFEDSMFNEGFFITDASSIDERFKISKEGGLFDEGEIAIGKTKKYTSAYVIRFAKNKKQTRGDWICYLFHSIYFFCWGGGLEKDRTEHATLFHRSFTGFGHGNCSNSSK